MRKKQGQHFSDIFEVQEKDPDGKRFDKGTYFTWVSLRLYRLSTSRSMCFAVSRIRAHSDMYEMDLLLDINSDLYPIDVRQSSNSFLSAKQPFEVPSYLTQVQDKFTLALSTTLSKDNQDSADFFDKVGQEFRLHVAACQRPT